MVFQTKKFNSKRYSSRSDAQRDEGIPSDLVNVIAEAVRDRLLDQGVPLQGSKTSSGPEWQKMLNKGAHRIGHSGDSPFEPHVLNQDDSLASHIDHTLLKPDATEEDIARVCSEARKYKFATVCVNSTYVGRVAQLLKGSGVKAIAVVGFPLGAASTASKAFETHEAIEHGAQEIDMVINIGALKSKDYGHVLEDIRSVVKAAAPAPVKVILETSNLNQDEKVIGSALSKAAGAAFVKTSTGFGSGGATAEDVELMRRVVGTEMGVKASGGIRTFEDADKMIKAGANRIGASASIEIVTHQAPSKSDTNKKDKSYKSSLY